MRLDFSSHFDYLMKCQLAVDREKEKCRNKVLIAVLRITIKLVRVRQIESLCLMK